MDKNKRIITILSVFTIIFTLVGGTFAWWTWTSNVTTGVAFTVEKEFSCSADGGQNINSTNIELQPTSDCTNSEYALQREIKITPTINRDNLTINLDMWLTVNNLSTNLSNSENLMYAITTNSSSCTDGVVSKGNFKGLTTGGKVNLLSRKEYTGRNLPQDTYYLYIWLDYKENSNLTQNESFDFSLGGKCTDTPKMEPEAPVLDSSMIPVTIANDGKVTTVSADDSDWYNYDNKEWANVVLVEDEARRNYYLSNLINNVEVFEEDIVEYYVWIPRYSYRIPDNVSCSDLSNPTPEEYPECYEAKYELTMSIDDFYDRLFEIDIENTSANYEFCMGMYEEESGYQCNEEDKANYRELYGEEPLSHCHDRRCYFYEDTYGISEILSEDEYNVIDEFMGNSIYETVGISTVDILFEKKENKIALGNATTQYRLHPAFWYDYDGDKIKDSNEMLSGIWVGKFETTGTVEKIDYYDLDGSWMGDAYHLHSVILPNKNFEIIPSDDVSEGHFQKRKILGLNDKTTRYEDLKNSGWAAVAYLAYSYYGINSKLMLNNSSITGCGTTNDNSSICEISYGSGVSSYLQSTTGNISGIFDMSGGEEMMILDHEAKLCEDCLRRDEIPVILSEWSEHLSLGHALKEFNDFISYPEYSEFSIILRNDITSVEMIDGINDDYESCGTFRGSLITK